MFRLVEIVLEIKEKTKRNPFDLIMEIFRCLYLTRRNPRTLEPKLARSKLRLEGWELSELGTQNFNVLFQVKHALTLKVCNV